MSIEHVPLLKEQRRLLALPHGFERFRAYLSSMTGGTDDMIRPLMVFNPMSDDRVSERLDAWIAAGAEDAAGEAVAEARARVQLEDRWRTGLVMADDAAGGWTHRELTDARHRMEGQPLVQRQWAVALLWSSEEPDLDRLHQEVLLTVYRSMHVHAHGQPHTLDDLVQQEAAVAELAGLPPARKPASDVEGIVRQNLHSHHFPTLFATFYGDDAARSAGYDSLGVPEGAALAYGRATLEPHANCGCPAATL